VAYFILLSSTFLTILLFPLKDDVLVVLSPPRDRRLRRSLGLADQGRVVVLADADGRRGAVHVDDVGRYYSRTKYAISLQQRSQTRGPPRVYVRPEFL